jgi:hypothetical protein
MASLNIADVLVDIENVSDDDLQAADDAFDKAKIHVLSDLADPKDPKNRKAVESKIDDTLRGTKLGAAALATVKEAFLTAWDASNADGAGAKKARPKPKAGDKTAPSKTKPDDPSLKSKPVGKTPLLKPGGLIDLDDHNFPTYRAEKDGEIKIFEIPGAFKIAPDHNKHPSRSFGTIEPWEWIIIYRDCGLTYALNLNSALSESKEALASKTDLSHPKWPVFYLDLDRVDPRPAGESRARSTVTNTIAEDRLSQYLVAEGELKGQYAMVEASVKAAFSYSAAKSSYSKCLYARARWFEPKCVVVTDSVFGLSPVFQHLLNVGFQKIKQEDRYDYFHQLFQLFGQVYPTSVTIGGRLEMERDIVSTETSDTIKKALDVSMAAKVTGRTASGSLSAGVEAGTGVKMTDANFIDVHMFAAVGGDKGLKAEPSRWLPTVNDIDKWEVIERGGFAQIQDRFEKKEKDLFNEMLNKTQVASWPIVGPVKNRRFPPLGQLRPYFPMGSAVTLRSMHTSPAGGQTPLAKYDWMHSGDYLKAADGGLKGIDGNPLERAGGVPSRGPSGEYAAPDTSWRASGETYQAYAPAPLRVAIVDGGSPEPSNLLWRFKFSGECLNDEPLLYLFTQDEKMVLCGFDAGPVKFASLVSVVPKKEQHGLVAGTAATKWLLQPAVPPGRAKLPAPDHASLRRRGWFRLYNPKLQRYLADLATMQTNKSWKDKEGNRYDETGQVSRTMLREPSGTASILKQDGTIDLALEQTQYARWSSQCWYIEEQAEEKRKTFDPLGDKYIKKTINDWQSGKSLEVK